MDTRTRLVIISGRSGSGKSTALHVLEDLGFYAIDNLPASLLNTLAAGVAAGQYAEQRRIAVSIDARNVPGDLSRLPEILEEVSSITLTPQILFLDADDQTLLQRFSETRRRHPLTGPHLPLTEAIGRERELLRPVAALADVTLDTSRLSLHDLRDLIRRRFSTTEGENFSLLFESFGFKKGTPADADFVFDVRALPNPYWHTALRVHDGREPPVIEFLEAQPEVRQMLDDIGTFLDRWLPRFLASGRSYVTVALGCTGGQHRSVYLCERLAERFCGRFPTVLLRHRELSNAREPVQVAVASEPETG
ncbi:MAG TPA: RNase adapter RapZ [Pseudomonadales bacterium]|nr:RNase adapter RapZ [Pseudomonadales bacterium]HMW14697.1 RNase adapter RapZ [Pseudomonadales bacterium]HMW82794.1 RNase adapter RapZ [Pseudomonadales bacterium]HMZ70272.1 RNase adapter RapZ [Pseudomonadales bacterium]HND26535.1 RNase adapter RapZ [Pseudomonadales bacterium]